MKISQRAERERLRKFNSRGPINLHHYCFYIILARRAKTKYEDGQVLSDWTDYSFTGHEISTILDFFGILDYNETQLVINYYIDCGLLEKKGELYHLTRFGIEWYNSLCQGSNK